MDISNKLDSIDPVDPKPVYTGDINYDTALQILIEELEKEGVWETNFRVKVAVKTLAAKILIQETKINEALAILMQK